MHKDTGYQNIRKELKTLLKTEIDQSKLKNANSEDVFNDAAIELLIETGSLAIISSNIFPQGHKTWSRNEAILGAHLIRLIKLIDSILDQTCKRRRETTMVFVRMAMETTINLIYLSRNVTDELFDSYIKYSFRHEKKLFDKIHSNVKQRNGIILPIEKRMLTSIEHKAEISGISIDKASTSHPKNWGNKNLFERAVEIGFDQAYLGIFGGPSHNIHGNWMDMLEHHLKNKNDYFIPNHNWSPPRPQILLTVSKLSLEAIHAYLNFIGHISARQAIIERLGQLNESILMVDSLHENYLNEEGAQPFSG